MPVASGACSVFQRALAWVPTSPLFLEYMILIIVGFKPLNLEQPLGIFRCNNSEATSGLERRAPRINWKWRGGFELPTPLKRSPPGRCRGTGVGGAGAGAWRGLNGISYPGRGP